MIAEAGKDNKVDFPVLKAVEKQEVRADMAFAIADFVPFEWVVLVFCVVRSV
jgi:hypothetical protein